MLIYSTRKRCDGRI